MLRRALFSLTLVLAGAAIPVAQAETQAPMEPADAPLSDRAPEVHAMLEAVGVYDVLAIMAQEGVDGALQLEADMFPGQGGAAWAAMAAHLNAQDRVIGAFEAAYPVDAMSVEEVAEVTAFARSAAGQRLIEGEVTARRAFLEPAVEDEASIRFRERAEAGDPRLDLLTDFIEANQLVERNVMGALNSNFAFYRGLSDGGAFEVDVPEELMLTEVWGQEAEIRTDTIEWLYSFQLVAYDLATDADLEAYIALSETEAGQALNAALFEAFDIMFNAMSYELGRAAATFIAGEDT